MSASPATRGGPRYTLGMATLEGFEPSVSTLKGCLKRRQRFSPVIHPMAIQVSHSTGARVSLLAAVHCLPNFDRR